MYTRILLGLEDHFSVLQDTAPELLLAAVFKEDWALMGRDEKFLSNPRGLHMKITGING
jgi:hypothetical protein